MKKRITSVLLALALCLTLLPTAALAADDSMTHTPSHSGKELKMEEDGTLKKGNDPWITSDIDVWGGGTTEKGYALTTGTYYLGSDLNFTDCTTAYAIMIVGNVTLCLNSHSITNSTPGNECVIGVYANDSSTLTLTDCKGGGEIKGGASYGVKVYKGYTFNMHGGTITGNRIGVEVNGSKGKTTKLNMYGGAISNNTSTGVTLTQYCEFTMSGGTISGNKGGVSTGGGTFTMTGGEISENKTKSNGGGVNIGNGGTFTMNAGAKITQNTADYAGGGVYVSDGTFIMNGGEIKSNTAETNGGGVSVTTLFGNSAFTMNGGEISSNTATYDSSSNYGGGVFMDKGTFTMSGEAKVTGNTAKTDGGGVYMNGSSTSGGTFTVSGTPTVTGNKRGLDETANNVYLSSGKTITIDTNLAVGSSIGVTAEATKTLNNGSTVAISKDAAYGYKDFFGSDDESYQVVYDSSNKVALKATPKTSLSGAVVTLNHNSFVFDGEGHTPKVDSVMLGSTKLTENTDYTVSVEEKTNAGENYKLTVTGKGKYEGTVTKTWKITPLTINVDLQSVKLNGKVYDGTPNGKSSDVTSVKFVDSSKNAVTLTRGTDYTIESVTYTDANASTSPQNVEVIVTLKNRNYTFAGSSNTAKVTMQGKITKAEAPETQAKTLEVKNNFADRYTLDLSKLLPPTVGKFGNIDCCTLDTVNLDGYYDSSDPATIVGSMLTLPIKAATSVEAGQQIGTVKVTVTTQNYEDITLTIYVNAVAASERTPTIDKEPTAQNLTYTGQAQELITKGAATNGTMMYRLEGATDYSAAIPTATEAGRYTVYYMVKGSDGYKDIKNETTMQVTATISRASQTVTIPSGKSITKNGVGVDISTWASAAGVPGGSDLGELTYSLTGGAYNGVTLDGTVLTVQKEATAKSIIIEVRAAGTKNYEASKEKTFTVTVTDKETVTISGLTYADKTYDGKIIVPTGKLTVTDSKVPAEELEVLYEGTNDTVYSSTEAPKNAGTYKVTYKVADSNKDYTGSVTYGFTISPKAVTAAPANKTITKGSAIPTFELTYTGLVTGETLTPSPAPVFSCFEKNGTTPVSTSTAAGTYTITWTNMDGTTFGNGNYTVTPSATGTLTISNRPSSGGGGGGGASAPTYPVSSSNASASAAVGGSVSISTKNASAGDTVTVTVSPEAGYRLEKLTVVDKNGKEIPVTLKDGKYTFTMPASQVEIKPVFEKISAETAEPTFPDVPSSAYYAEPVKWAAEKGITSGTKDGGFAPGNTCTRAQIVTFLWRAAGSPEPQTTQTGMTDVSPEAYYAKAVAWAIENGITVGRSDGSFNPNGTCTRANGVTFLYRAAKAAASGNDAGFSDVAADAYYAAAVQWALENGITNGQSSGLFGPNGACTRAQIVTFLYRMYVKA